METRGGCPKAGDAVYRVNMPGSVSAEKQPSVWNIANLLTIMRLVFIPVFILVLFVDSGNSAAWRWVAFGVFTIAAITDQIDGLIARKCGLVTDFGKIADPIADKALIGSALISLSALCILPWWATEIIIAREIGVTLLRFCVLRHGVIAASRGGKVKAMLQSIAVGLYLVPLPNPWEFVAHIVMVAALIITLATGIEYVNQALVLRREAACE